MKESGAKPMAKGGLTEAWASQTELKKSECVMKAMKAVKKSGEKPMTKGGLA